LLQRSSKDPAIRLRGAAKWTIVKALVAHELWDQGIGHAVIVRQEPERLLVVGFFLVDVYCLGVKDAFWRSGTSQDIEDMIAHLETVQSLRATAPSCLAKIVKGAIDFAQSFGFPPHPDYRHASMLLDGIDPSTCPNQYTFGRNGKPFYIRGPYDSLEKATAISRRVQNAQGHYVVALSGSDSLELATSEGAIDKLEGDVSPDESL
jgi:hypothetical protein